MYHTEIPEELVSHRCIEGWDFGGVYLAKGIAELVESLMPNVDSISADYTRRLKYLLDASKKITADLKTFLTYSELAHTKQINLII